MKNLTNKSTLAILLLAISIQFIACDGKTKVVPNSTKSIVAEQVTIAPVYREPLVFITGVDTEKTTYYISAKNYFEEKQFEVVTEAYSLQEIILWLNNNYDNRVYSDIHIVSKNNPWKGMDLETSINGKNITTENLLAALGKGSLTKLNDGITSETNIVFHASGLSNNKVLTKVFKNVFSTDLSPSIICSEYHTIFGGEFSPHFLAKPYYGFYPTSKSPGRVDLSKEFAKNYPNEKGIDWYAALHNKSERFIGDAYTFQYNLPVKFEFSYDGEEEVPYFENTQEIIAWILENEELTEQMKSYDIPLEKFRWNSKTSKDKLVIKGITTVLCVLKPLTKPYGDLEHMTPEIDNLRLYTIE